MTVSYIVNGKTVPKEELKNIEIRNQDFIRYYEALRQEVIDGMIQADEQPVKAG